MDVERGEPETDAAAQSRQDVQQRHGIHAAAQGQAQTLAAGHVAAQHRFRSRGQCRRINPALRIP